MRGFGRSRLLVLTVIGAAAVILLGGCTAVAPHPTASPAATTVRTPSSSVVTDITDPPGTQKGFVGALKDVTVKSCDSASSPTRFTGVVTNPTDTKQSYRIYVSILVGEKTIGISQVNATSIPPHATKNWSGTLNTSAAGGRCILRVERTTDN